MSHLSLRRTAAVALAAAGCVTALPTTASAGGDSFFSRSSGQTASIEWLEAGVINASVPGNWHFGVLWVEDLGRGRATAFGTVFDVQCVDGVTPYNPGGGGHGGPVPPPVEEPAPCELVGLRFLDASPSQLSFTTNKKLTSARLTGNLSVGDGHGSPTGSPPVDVTLTAIGDAFSSEERGTYTDEYGTYSYRYSFTGRNAAVGPGRSFIGPMVFDDEPGETSSAQLGSYRSSSRGRS